MKQQIIELKKKLLAVELPEGAKDIEISVLGDIMYRHKLGLDILWQSNGSEVKNLVGKLTDIKEEQFKGLVDKFNCSGAYRDYTEKKPFDPADDLASFFLTAKESFFPKLEADGIVFENPIPKPGATDHSGIKDLNEKLDKYYEAQEKVWNLDNTYVFEIL